MKSERELAQTNFLTAISDGLSDIEACQGRILPKTPENYLDIQKRLATKESNGVTVFFGGPLDLEKYGISDSWLTPIEVRDNEGFSNFHVISIGCANGTDIRDAEVKLNFAPEVNLKLGKSSDSTVNDLHNLLNQSWDGKKRVIIRPSITGSLAFPLITTPFDVPNQEVFKSRLSKVIAILGLRGVNTSNVDVSKIDEQGFELDAEFETFCLSQPKIIDTEIGNVWVYGVIAMDDPWVYYEIFCMDDLKKIREKRKIVIRTDSGCDIGMLYGDLGCECHPQLLSALEEAKKEGGLVVHIPTQDGRGYGMNTKIETEAHKRGIKAVFNGDAPPLKTLSAAKKLFGEKNYDIRTYDGVASILYQLGFRNVVLLTDNRIKFNHLSSKYGLKVERKETGTLEKFATDSSREHIEEKHQSEDYFSD